MKALFIALDIILALLFIFGGLALSGQMAWPW